MPYPGTRVTDSALSVTTPSSNVPADFFTATQGLTLLHFSA
jgi:hypothetical protein